MTIVFLYRSIVIFPYRTTNRLKCGLCYDLGDPRLGCDAPAARVPDVSSTFEHAALG